MLYSIIKNQSESCKKFNCFCFNYFQIPTQLFLEQYPLLSTTPSSHRASSERSISPLSARENSSPASTTKNFQPTNNNNISSTNNNLSDSSNNSNKNSRSIVHFLNSNHNHHTIPSPTNHHQNHQSDGDNSATIIPMMPNSLNLQNHTTTTNSTVTNVTPEMSHSSLESLQNISYNLQSTSSPLPANYSPQHTHESLHEQQLRKLSRPSAAEEDSASFVHYPPEHNNNTTSNNLNNAALFLAAQHGVGSFIGGSVTGSKRSMDDVLRKLTNKFRGSSIRDHLQYQQHNHSQNNRKNPGTSDLNRSSAASSSLASSPTR